MCRGRAPHASADATRRLRTLLEWIYDAPRNFMGPRERAIMLIGLIKGRVARERLAGYGWEFARNWKHCNGYNPVMRARSRRRCANPAALRDMYRI
ncbi:hypothetical protein EVAR_55936_1 [Eumeta japonica]|uniref:Uncharacterized protein n=1 Tax=Eumeta variegata TaxID=151549 RepID=A0A4C1YVE8_EUMVA|nr:hypothetical protein EVAR_55936_1 [Eumeta japonica]